MKFLGWFSLFFWVVGFIAVLKGLLTEDTWILSLGTLMLVISNFFEIIINRDMIRTLKTKRTGGKK